MSAIHVSNLTKSWKSIYGSRQVLDRCSFDVQSGTLTCLAGASGAGKSTLLQILSGSLDYDDGLVLVEGQNLKKMTSKEKAYFVQAQLSVIYQDFHLIETLSLKDNIRLPFYFSKKPVDEVYFQILCQQLELDAILNEYPASCSSGQLQKAAVARALLKRSPLILADEPTAHLDRKSALVVFQLLHEQTRLQGSSILMSCHDLELAKLAGNIFILENGKAIPYAG
jgi:ABC-type lipoprotein export system ATPase subunit